jgi:type II secretory pathway pseudopilin PulG
MARHHGCPSHQQQQRQQRSQQRQEQQQQEQQQQQQQRQEQQQEQWRRPGPRACARRRALAPALLLAALIAAGAAPPAAAKPTPRDVQLTLGPYYFNPSIVKHRGVYLSTARTAEMKRVDATTWWFNEGFICTAKSAEFEGSACRKFDPWQG